MSFTPGPWQARSYGHPDDGPEHHSWEVVDSSDVVICDPEGNNARLIAAAPEMYDLLKKSVGDHWLYLDEARALLARIDGKEPGT